MRSSIRGVFRKRALARRAACAGEFGVGEIERRQRIGFVVCDKNIDTRLKEAVESFPVVAQDRNSTGRRLEQPS